jgi:phenylacetate-coenzyme A ligase PaaK-like adenylate-forming protein
MTLALSRRVSHHFREAEARRAMLLARQDDESMRLQLAAIQRTWDAAVAAIPYYRRLVDSRAAPPKITRWSDVRQIPVLTRQILQDHERDFRRTDRAPHSTMKTAGSTGEPLRIGMDQPERDLMRIVKLAEWQSLGYEPSSRLFLIWGHGHLLGTGWRGRINHARRKMADAWLGYRRVDAYRLDQRSCEEYAAALIRFRPAGLIGYASALDLFARYTTHLQDQFRSLGLKFVLSTSEAPPRSDTVSLLEQLFGCVVVQEYGGAEFGQVAFKRGETPFCVYADLNYVEAESAFDATTAEESLLVTSLYSRYLPLVRYRVGDAVVGAARMSNGHVGHFSAVAGRINDVIEIADGKYIHSVAVFHCIHQEPAVLGIQMVLTDAAIEILLVADPPDRAEMERRIRARLAQVHPRLAQAAFRYVEDVQPTRAGKRRWYVDRRTTAACVASRES